MDGRTGSGNSPGEALLRVGDRDHYDRVTRATHGLRDDTERLPEIPRVTQSA